MEQHNRQWQPDRWMAQRIRGGTRGLLAIGTLMALALLTLTAASGARTATAASVTIQSFSFAPASVTVAAGETVTWTNQQAGVPHTVTADDGSFDSGVLMSGQSFSMSFSQPGTFTYHCNIHPFMHGTVVVMAAASAAPQTGGQTAPPAGGSAGGMSVHFHAGFNLIGVPAGTSLPASAVYGFDPTTNGYVALASGQSPQAGTGYWASFDQDTDVSLPAGSSAPVSMNAPAATWMLVGNPSGTQPATIAGADAAWKFDAAQGSYVAATVLNPGEGAWVMSMSGGRITVAPGGAAAAAPTASPTPRPTAPPAATQPVTQPTMTPPTNMPPPYTYPY